MTTPNLLQHRSASTAFTWRARASELSLPREVLAQTWRRTLAVGVTFAVLWSIPLVLFLLVAPHVQTLPILTNQLWPMPGAAIAGVGLACSLLLTVLTPRLSEQPARQQVLGSSFLVITAFLFGLLEYWVPDFDRPQATFIGVAILAYSSIVPSTPGRTLAVGLLAATMAPLAFGITRLRGVQAEAGWFEYLFGFLPNYLCALLAMIPAGIIRQLGRQVRKARELGSYRLEEILGRGGMGEVYKGSHQLLARPAAVKLIRPEVLGAIDAGRARVILERFRREAEAAASLRSPHSISLYDFGVAQDGTFFFVMELLDGLDLESLVQRFGPVEPARAVHLLAQACESLEEAHQRGLVHRDVKPSNIFTCRMGLALDFVKVLDYGLVKHEANSSSADLRLTAPDDLAGTPAYMAPEAVLGTVPLDHRADIYALGCVAYWLVTGQLVFEAPNPVQLLFRHAHNAPVPPSRRSEFRIAPALDQLILDCLAKHPDQRPQSALDLARRLRATVPAEESWTQERAERWWRRHRPETAQPAPTACDQYLSKTLAEGWATPDLARNRVVAASAVAQSPRSLGMTPRGMGCAKSGTIPILALLALVCLGPSPAHAQFGATDTVTAGPEYQANAGHRFLFGSGYRSIWTTPFEAPVLDLASYAGGLTPVARTGGQQTRVLRLRSRDGREFFFRSLSKDPSSVLPPDLYETVAGDLVRDQTKSALPTAPLVVARLLTAAGIPHDDPMIVVLPDDSLLGEFRAAFRGLLGTLEERVGGQGPAAHWHGAEEVIDSDSLIALITRSTADRADPRAFLKARLFDVMIGDWDRHRDQWRWVRFDDREPRAWQPVPIDRDQAFAKYDGLLLSIGRQAGVPQLTNYGPGYPGMVGATWNGRELDRRFLVGLELPVWDSVAGALAALLTDSVILDAVHALPPEHYALVGPTLIRWIEARRDALPEAAARFYRLLAAEVDVHATDGADRAAVTRLPGGAVELSLTAARDSAPYLKRRFNPGETRDLRLFLEDGADTAIVRGEGGGITLRVLGGGGPDALIDSAHGGAVHFYDDPSGPARTAGREAPVDRRPYVLPAKKRETALPPRDWGTRGQYLLWGYAGPDIGLFVGGGYAFSRYGFRKLPFAYRHRIRTGFATGPTAFRVEYAGEFHRENSGVTTLVEARASGIEVIRFHGFGNDTRAPGSDEFYRVTQQQYRLAPSLMVPLTPRLFLKFGPELTYVSTDRRPGRFLATINPYGVGQFGELGARASLAFDSRDHPLAPTRGVRLEAGGAVHPAWWDVQETFGEAWGEATMALTARMPLAPTLALRAGGRKLWGAYPYFEAAFIGDRNTVRLGREERYAGDASAYGSAELRLCLTRMMLVVPADFGIFGLADAGRVFLAGESSDTWHTAFGGGVWLGFLSRANTVSAALASSRERTRLYLQAGFGF